MRARCAHARVNSMGDVEEVSECNLDPCASMSSPFTRSPLSSPPSAPYTSVPISLKRAYIKFCQRVLQRMNHFQTRTSLPPHLRASRSKYKRRCFPIGSLSQRTEEWSLAMAERGGGKREKRKQGGREREEHGTGKWRGEEYYRFAGARELTVCLHERAAAQGWRGGRKGRAPA